MPVFGVAVKVAVNAPLNGTLTITHCVSVVETIVDVPALPSVGGGVLGSVQVYGPLYIVTDADAGPPVGFPAGIAEDILTAASAVKESFVKETIVASV